MSATIPTPPNLNDLIAGFAKQPQLAMRTATSDISYAQLASILDTQRQQLLAQGLTPADVLLLPVGKQAGDVIRLLAALQTACATLVYPHALPASRLEPLQTFASVRLDQHGKLHRLQPPQLGANPVSEPLLGVLSSGSTGAPKPIWHRTSHFLASAAASQACLPLPQQGFSLLSLPLNHVGGLGVIFRAFLNHSGLLFDVAADQRDSYQQHPIQRVSLVPTQLQRLLEAHQPAPECQVLLGGAPIAESLVNQARQQGWRLHRSYGLSEMASQVITELSPNQWQVLPHADIKIINDEIWLRGSSLFLGYGSPAQPACPLTDGWFATRDLATFRNAQFQFMGRHDNLFISGGENVSPESIEQQFIDALLVHNIVVVPKQNAQWGSQTVALVEPKPGVNRKHLQAFSQQQLLPHEQPRHYYAWQPQTSLKVQRAELIKQVNQHDLEEID